MNGVITRIDISHHRLALDPPFPAAWDPRPRTQFPATIVQVRDDAGHVGIGSGDPMHGFAGNETFFIGHDPLDLERHATVLSNIAFHAGRPWPLDVAMWDLAGHIREQPVWAMVGGRDRRVRAYASTGTHRPPQQTAKLARAVTDAGFPALKLRFGRQNPDDDFAVLSAVRDEVGDEIELMVDCNQGWRMPWDTRPPWDLDHATAVAHRIAAEHVYWMEEPLHRGDYQAMAELRRRVDVPIAGGELTREPYEFRELLRQECLDVFQPDCVVTGGITGLRRLAAEIDAAGKIFTPHTWGNGVGLLANAHLAAGTVGAPFLEFPFDPPQWTTARRDFLLTETVEIDGAGWIQLSDRPGLGCSLAPEVLASTATTVTTYT
ncbi:mandelate racemase/muconate lactonizing enzyme family protein [soil metagenome]